MKVFFVGGVDTGVGKTYVTQKIIQTLQDQSIKAIAIKPIETGISNDLIDDPHSLKTQINAMSENSSLRSIDSKIPHTSSNHSSSSDALMHLSAAQKIFPHLTLKDINPYAFPKPAAPFVADEGGIIDIQSLYTHIQRFEGEVEVLLIEGAGGLWTPIKKDFFMISFALELQKRFNARTLIVCDDALGMIHRFLSAKFAADSLGLDYSMLINLKDLNQFREISLPFICDYSFQTEIETFIAKEMRWI